MQSWPSSVPHFALGLGPRAQILRGAKEKMHVLLCGYCGCSRPSVIGLKNLGLLSAYDVFACEGLEWSRECKSLAGSSLLPIGE